MPPTSIVATIGPSLLEEGRIQDTIEAGVGGFRIPLSRQADRGVELAETIRSCGHQAGVDVVVYLDVPGLKRFLKIDKGHRSGDEVVASFGTTWDAPAPCIVGPDSVVYLDGATELWIGDGETSLAVVDRSRDRIRMRVQAGILEAGFHGISVPGHPEALQRIEASHLRVLRDLAWAEVILSFIESPEQVKRLAAATARDPRAVWAKVETANGVQRASDIAGTSAGVLIGRGDLLLDAGPVHFAALESQAVAAVLESGRPLMVGTQLWTASSGMALPHRSELSWVWHLMTRGVDHLLLSDETTIGRDPAETVRTLVSLAAAAAR